MELAKHSGLIDSDRTSSFASTAIIDSVLNYYHEQKELPRFQSVACKRMLELNEQRRVRRKKEIENRSLLCSFLKATCEYDEQSPMLWWSEAERNRIDMKFVLLARRIFSLDAVSIQRH